jgi:Tfp pilus assembly protein FimV
MHLRLLLLAIVVGVTLVAGAGMARGDGGARPPAPRTYTVHAGDTLWSIGGQVAPGSDRRIIVDRLRSVNHLHGGLQAGQQLVLPRA